MPRKRRAPDVSQDPNAAAGSGTPLWTIGQVIDQPVIGQGGTFVSGKDVEVVFWDGSIEHLSYPKSQYNPAQVGQAAQAAAERHLSVKALQGPIIPPDLTGG